MPRSQTQIATGLSASPRRPLRLSASGLSLLLHALAPLGKTVPEVREAVYGLFGSFLKREIFFFLYSRRRKRSRLQTTIDTLRMALFTLATQQIADEPAELPASGKAGGRPHVIPYPRRGRD